jgi:hypothetical protein|tara:strand:+ start:1035 stop:1304 length:270 start_codon:yes stop_codon:yes gene_type:complete
MFDIITTISIQCLLLVTKYLRRDYMEAKKYERKSYDEAISKLNIGDTITVDRRWGYPSAQRIFKAYGFGFEVVRKPEPGLFTKTLRRIT